VSRPKPNPWDLPTLHAIGAPYTEAQDERARRGVRSRQRLWRRAALAGAGLSAALLAGVLALFSGGPALAHNILGEAPAAAERAGSLAFRSTLTIRVDGQRRPGLAEEGAIDFVTGTYATSTRFDNTDSQIDRRSVNGVLYSSHGRAAASATATRWYSAPIAKGAPGGFDYESDAFMDPPSLFRTLAHISSPVRRVGEQTIEGSRCTVYRLSTNLAAFLRPSAGHFQNPGMYRRVRARLEVWVDRQGRPRQVLETFSAGATVMRTAVTFSGYGQPVTVNAPPNSQVRSTHGSRWRNPLSAGPGPLLAPLLFFQP